MDEGGIYGWFLEAGSVGDFQKASDAFKRAGAIVGPPVSRYLEGTLAGGGVSSERDNELVVAYMPATDDTENDRTTFVFFPIALARATQDRVSPTKVRKVPQKSS